MSSIIYRQVHETTAALEMCYDEMALMEDDETMKDAQKRVEIFSLLQRAYALVAEFTELTGEAIKDSAWLKQCNNLPLASICLGSFLESVRTLHKLVTAPVIHSEQQRMHENPSVDVLTNNLRAQLRKGKEVLKILSPPDQVC